MPLGQSCKDSELILSQSLQLPKKFTCLCFFSRTTRKLFLCSVYNLWLFSPEGLVFWELILLFQKGNLLILYCSFIVRNLGSFCKNISNGFFPLFIFPPLGLHELGIDSSSFSKFSLIPWLSITLSDVFHWGVLCSLWLQLLAKHRLHFPLHVCCLTSSASNLKICVFWEVKEKT